jgi:glycosyltransferase involved in cell wall biosynthesis
VAVTRTLRVTAVMNIVTPYTTRVFQEVAGREGIELNVLYESLTEPNRHWNDIPSGYEHAFMKSFTLDLRRFVDDTFIHLPRRPLRAIAAHEPDVVIGAGAGTWSSPSNFVAWYGRQRGWWAFVPWWGSFPRDRPSLARRIADPWVRQFVRRSDAWLAYGSRARQDLVQLGAAEDATFVTASVAAPPLSTPTTTPRESRGRFLYVGQLIERKGVLELLEAFARVSGGRLFIAGDGPLEDAVRAAGAADARIEVLGHLGQPALESLYAKVDALVVPSRYEVWGLVVNEAMAFGLPVVVSDTVGAVDDLVYDGVTGVIVPAGDVGALTDAMKDVGSWSLTRRAACSAQARTMVGSWSIVAAADGIVAASRAAHARVDARTARK